MDNALVDVVDTNVALDTTFTNTHDSSNVFIKTIWVRYSADNSNGTSSHLSANQDLIGW